MNTKRNRDKRNGVNAQSSSGLTTRLAALILSAALVIAAAVPAAEISAYAISANSTASSRMSAASAPAGSTAADTIRSETVSTASVISNSSSTATSKVSTNAVTTTTAAATTSATKTATTITGYKTSINKLRSKDVTVSATITPAYGGRTVKLQRYDSASGKWVTMQKTRTASAASADVNFTITKKDKEKTTSYWRIYVNKNDSASWAKSRKITLTTRNIRSQKLSAKAACIYRIDGDGKGTLIYSKSASVERAQASTTKLMTAVLLVESGKLETKTTFSSHAVATPWASGVAKQGDIFNTHDLLYAMMLPSSNDAATAVAEKVGGSETAFVNMMNAKARKMGLKKTQFRNPHGLDADGHYTTAKELAMLTAYAYTFPEIRECWATNYKTIYSTNTGKRWNLWSTNAIFSYVKNFLGGKTGTESNAGCCFTGIYKYKGSTYVTVVLGSGYGFSRWSDTKTLHQYIRKYAATKY